jgi:hypothetical protein
LIRTIDYRLRAVVRVGHLFNSQVRRPI